MPSKKPFVLYIEIEEEITAIVDKIKRVRHKNIHLAVPVKAAIFHSLINLKILKKKLQELDKNGIIVTQDPIGIKLARQIKLEAITKIQLDPKEKGDQKQKPALVNAESTQLGTDKPYLRKENKSTLGDILHKIKHKNTKVAPSPEKIKPLPPLSAANKKSIFLIITASIFLFLFISYIALPGCKIYIRPRSEVLEQPVNLVLADAEINKAQLQNHPLFTVPSYPIEKTFEKKIVFETQSKDFIGTNSSGKIKIINTATRDWPLKEKTQFESPEGIIFRMTSGVIVPSAKDEKNGEIWVDVIADPFDKDENLVGARGNIAPTKFTIRKLSEYNQQLIWGVSEAPMTGGLTKFHHIVREEDVELAQKHVEEELEVAAREELKKFLAERNNINRTNLVLINDSNYINREVSEIKFPENILNQELDKFEIYTKVKVQSIAFNYDLFWNILSRELRTRVHPDMQLREDYIDKQSITYQIIDENKSLKQLKLSVKIKGIQEYTIEPTSESGLRFSQKIQENIAGLPIIEAENYLSNLPEVAEVEISVWPFWSSTLPKVPSNIQIKLKED